MTETPPPYNPSDTVSTELALGQVPGRAAQRDLLTLANELSKSPLVPDAFRGKPQNCYLAAQIAAQMREPTYSIMRAMYVPQQAGADPGFSAEFYVARLRKSGAIWGTIRYEVDLYTERDLEESPKWSLPDLEVAAIAIDRESRQEIRETFTMRMAVANGWAKLSKKGHPSNYHRFPEHQLKKRAATWLIRNHYPDVMCGLPEVTEIHDVQAARDVAFEDVSQQAVDRLNVPPGKRTAPPDAPDDKPLDHEPDEVPPEDRVSLERANAILDYMAVDGIDGDLIQEHLTTIGHESPATLSEDQAQELLDMIEGGDFGHHEG